MTWVGSLSPHTIPYHALYVVLQHFTKLDRWIYRYREGKRERSQEKIQYHDTQRERGEGVVGS